MTQEEIIEMARQAGMAYEEKLEVYVANIDDLQDFAKLIAAKEREEFAVHAVDIARRAVAKEREACAMLCLWHNNTLSQNPTLFHMAELIRARGQQ